MKCPHCGHQDDKVLESRTVNDGTTIRRRRICLKCGYRFTSYERIQERPITVIKKNGHKEAFDIHKVRRGITIATDKRSIDQETIENCLRNIEDQVAELAGAKHVVTSVQIGELTLQELYKVDDVAYIRFASVYRKFDNVGQFIEEIRELSAASGKARPKGRSKKKD